MSIGISGVEAKKRMYNEKIYPSIAKNRLRKLKNITYVSESDLPLDDRDNPQAMIWEVYKIIAGIKKYKGNFVDDRIATIIDTILYSPEVPQITYIEGGHGGVTDRNSIKINYSNMTGLLSTTLHEMVHYADYIVGEKDNFLSELKDVTNDVELNNLESEAAPTSFRDVFELYDGPEVIQELVARAFEIILHDRDNALKFLRENAPTLLDFIDNHFIPQCQKSIEKAKMFGVGKAVSGDKEYLCGNLSDELYNDEDFLIDEDDDLWSIPKKDPEFLIGGAGGGFGVVADLPEVVVDEAIDRTPAVIDYDTDNEKSSSEEDRDLVPEPEEDDIDNVVIPSAVPQVPALSADVSKSKPRGNITV